MNSNEFPETCLPASPLNQRPLAAWMGSGRKEKRFCGTCAGVMQRPHRHQGGNKKYYKLQEKSYEFLQVPGGALRITVNLIRITRNLLGNHDSLGIPITSYDFLGIPGKESCREEWTKGAKGGGPDPRDSCLRGRKTSMNPNSNYVT